MKRGGLVIKLIPKNYFLIALKDFTLPSSI